MACQIFRVGGLITNFAKNNIVRNNAVSFLKPHVLLIQNARNAGFFNRRPAKFLWKSVTNVSNAGRRRGRGRNAPRIKDLNRGQTLGCGKIPISYPGLNSPVMQGSKLVKQHKFEDDSRRLAKLQDAQSQFPSRRFKKIHPLDRGWSGSCLGGRKLGPPDPIDDQPFTDFETWILQCTQKSVMSSNLGRVKRIGVIVVTGNGNGLVGFATKFGSNVKGCLNTAKNRAGQRLIYVERYENHTVMHDFFAQFASSKIFVKQKPKGFGLVCHRAIRTICQAVGITDLYAKVEGSKNLPNVIKAFFIGLLKQKTHQQMANEKKLHLVEFKGNTSTFPKVLASPDTVRKPEEIQSNEILDFNQYVMEGRIVLNKKKPPPFYTKLPSYSLYMRKMERRRDHDKVRIKLRAQYGEICSFLTEKYPEARPAKWKKHANTEDTEGQA